jgi:hypothetical protein
MSEQRYRLTEEYSRYTASGIHIEGGETVELDANRAESLVEDGILERAGGPETNNDSGENEE